MTVSQCFVFVLRWSKEIKLNSNFAASVAKYEESSTLLISILRSCYFFFLLPFCVLPQQVTPLVDVHKLLGSVRRQFQRLYCSYLAGNIYGVLISWSPSVLWTTTKLDCRCECLVLYNEPVNAICSSGLGNVCLDNLHSQISQGHVTRSGKGQRFHSRG